MTHPLRKATFGRQPAQPDAEASGTAPERSAGSVVGGARLGLAIVLVFIGGKIGYDRLTMPSARSVAFQREFEARAATPSSPLGRFVDVTSDLRDRLKCGKIGPGLGIVGVADHGRLFDCVQGASLGAKIFVNEDAVGNVKNVKVMWNSLDRYSMAGDPPSMREFLMQIVAVTKVYPDVEFAPLAKTVTGDDYRTSFSFGEIDVLYERTPGPSIDEHLFTFASN